MGFGGHLLCLCNAKQKGGVGIKKIRKAAASLSQVTGQSEVALLFTPCLIGRALSRVTAVGDAFLWGQVPRVGVRWRLPWQA